MGEQLKLFEMEPTAPKRGSRLIGLHAPAEGGKDTAYGFIQEALPGFEVERDAFADRLKLSAGRALGCTGTVEEVIQDMNFLKESGQVGIFDEGGNLVGGISGREFLQFYGTEAHRDVFVFNFWVEAGLPDSTDPNFGREKPFDILIITDVRFENEAQAIRACGGSLWKIKRDVRIDASNHASEAGLPDEMFDYIIDNDGTLDEFKVKVLMGLDK